MKLLTKNLLTLEGRKKEFNRISQYFDENSCFHFNILHFGADILDFYKDIFIFNNDKFTYYQDSDDNAKSILDDFVTYIFSITICSNGRIYFYSYIYKSYLVFDFITKDFLSFLNETR